MEILEPPPTPPTENPWDGSSNLNTTISTISGLSIQSDDDQRELLGNFPLQARTSTPIELTSTAATPTKKGGKGEWLSSIKRKMKVIL